MTSLIILFIALILGITCLVISRILAVKEKWVNLMAWLYGIGAAILGGVSNIFVNYYPLWRIIEIINE